MSAEYYNVKVVVVGESGTGKTSLIQRFVHSSFDPNVEPSTRVESSSKVIEINDVEVKLGLWDTTGSEKYRSLGPIYYKGAVGGIIVYDITKRSTFETVRFWASELIQHAQTKGSSGPISLGIAANKCDLATSSSTSSTGGKEEKEEGGRQRQVEREEGERLAKELGAVFFEISCKSDPEDNLKKLIVQTILQGVRDKPPFLRRENLLPTDVNVGWFCQCSLL